MTSIQAGQRAFFLFANVIMASTTFLKDTGCTGILRLLFLGIFLPSVLVSGQNISTSTTAVNSTSSTAASTSTTAALITTTTAATATATQPPTSITSVATATSTAQPPATSTSGSTSLSTTTQSSTFTTSGATASTTIQSSTTTTSTTAPPPITTATSTTSGGTAMTTTTQPATPTTTSGGTTTTITQSTTTTSGGGMSGMTGTIMSNSSSMSMIYCPSFICNYSDCYTMYTSQNATLCTSGSYCQLTRQVDSYTADCSASCADSCINGSQINCSVNCCNFTGCLNGSFASMMMETTSVIATTTKMTTTPVTTTAATSPQTTAKNGNKCHQGTCTGTACYTDFREAALQTCSSTQPHCQLKKETMNSNLQWTAGCITNCSGQTPCKASTQPPCHLECCNATMTSCLWLNGTLNVPSFATRGPHLNTELITSLLCLLAITLLL